LGEGYFELLGNRIGQNLARLRGGHGKWHEITWHRPAGGRYLRAMKQRMRIAEDLRIGRRELDLHFRPVGVEFFREYQWQRCIDALSHFGGRTDDVDGVVGSDADPGVELGRLRRSERFSALAQPA